MENSYCHYYPYVNLLNTPILQTQLNKALLIKDSYFTNQKGETENHNIHNIDELVSKSIIEADLKKQIEYLLKAASLSEKFHSYFHFEETFLHLTEARYLKKKQINNQIKCEKIISAYKNAIFQDHMNVQAHIELIEYCKEHNLNKEYDDAVNYANLLEIDLLNGNKQDNVRPFTSFIDYLKFALNNSITPEFINEDFSEYKIEYHIQNQSMPITKNFWLSLIAFEIADESKLESAHELLSKSIEQLKASHKLYHQNVAIIYYNCGVVYNTLKEFEIAKNMFVKSQNLDALLIAEKFQQ